MTTVPKDCEDYINQQIELFAESIDKPIFLQIKEILNKYFGDNNNQIIKPTFADSKRFLMHNYDNMNLQLIKSMDSARQAKLWGHLKVYIKFDDITITNGSTSHDIKDLWVRFNVGKTGAVSNLQGLRSYMTFEEARVGYMHSHLPATPMTSSTPPNFEHFCLGTGEITQVIMFLADQFDTINFTLFCLHLKNFLAWESIDGVPHIYLNGIESGNNRRGFNSGIINQSPETFNQTVITKVVEIIKDQIATTVPIDVLRTIINPFIVDDDVSILLNEKLEIWLGTIISSFTPEQSRLVGGERSTFLCRKNRDGVHIRIGSRNRNTEVREPTAPLFQFKGNPIYLTIGGLNQPLNDNINQNNNVYANPQVSREFVSSFSADFSEVCYRNEKAIKENSLKNLFQTTGSNLLAVR